LRPAEASVHDANIPFAEQTVLRAMTKNITSEETISLIKAFLDYLKGHLGL
jgi:hypothetical protein